MDELNTEFVIPMDELNIRVAGISFCLARRPYTYTYSFLVFKRI